MSTSRYTTFQIRNTASLPMLITLTDPDGTSLAAVTIDPGQESLQVAPVGTAWRIEFATEAFAAMAGSKPGSDVTKPGSDVTKPGSDVTKPGSDVTKPGSDVTKPGSDVTKPGSDVTK